MITWRNIFISSAACSLSVMATCASAAIIHGSTEAASQDNSYTAFTVTQSYGGTIAISSMGNAGDMEVSFQDTGGNYLTFYERANIVAEGVVNSGWGIATTAQNGRVDGLSTAENLWSGDPYALSKAYGTTGFRPRNLTSGQVPAIIMDIAATAAPGNSDEWNVNTTVAVFPRDEFIGGYYGDTTQSGSTLADPNVAPGVLDAYAGITLGTEVIPGNFIDVADNGGEYPYTGAYSFILSGLGDDTDQTDATRNGLLFASSAKNENNFTTTRVAGVDTFEIFVKDDAEPTLRLEEDDFYFVYIPLGHEETAAMGRIDNEGDTMIGSGSYVITQA